MKENFVSTKYTFILGLPHGKILQIKISFFKVVCCFFNQFIYLHRMTFCTKIAHNNNTVHPDNEYG